MIAAPSIDQRPLPVTGAWGNVGRALVRWALVRRSAYARRRAGPPQA